jgi:glycosyltransferase involved in cell wall biosynthesis
MNNEKKRIKIAYLTSRDPHDRRSWSGLIYYIAQALQKHSGEVLYWHVNPSLLFKANLIRKLARESSQFLLKKQYTSSFFLSKSFAKAGNHWLAEQSVDVIVAPDGAIETAFLETEIPIVLVGDSTFSLLFDGYPGFSNLMERSVYEIKTIQDLALKKASAIIYSSAWAARSAIQDYATDPRKIHVVPFGANLDESPAREIALARKKSDRCRLLFLGVEWVRKGGDIAFETLLKLEEMGFRAELIVCGCNPPKAFSHERMRVIPFLNKNDERQRKELERLFMLTDFLLVPTRNECYGLVFCEANAFGIPIITSNTGGVPEVVRDGENGFLLPLSARGDAYAEVIAKIYRDDERYAQLVQASRAAFETRLNWEAWGVGFTKILVDLLDCKYSCGDP